MHHFHNTYLEHMGSDVPYAIYANWMCSMRWVLEAISLRRVLLKISPCAFSIKRAGTMLSLLLLTLMRRPDRFVREIEQNG